ncbi:hypothetical protein [Ruegeria faecimaris]|uniref:Uncharacterized protein n=1 Tax=Ruegeria faecimaris TaxID=686389 RepID=A0A521E5Q3_9RHOB|nr:hypothetical protein [Ruegeria faecimaris]SMO79259.1 hypothetical protein SAMN06265380_109121 [Ruegeria faecimaris]
MRFLLRWTKRLILVLILAGIALAAPILYVETSCRGTGQPPAYTALIDPAHHRAETRTLMTYPEWHIVHAYEDYAEVLRTGDPHDYGFWSSITGFWGSLCDLNRTASALGQVDGATKQMVYVIGASFSAELALKAAYEETLGRLATVLRGSQRAPLDDVSAQQAAAYAAFLQQVPWYKWPFADDAQSLDEQNSGTLRDNERAIALGLEYGAKQAYAGVIEQAVAQVGADELTLRMIVTGASADSLSAYPGVKVISEGPNGVEIETPRYRTLTNLLAEMASAGVEIIEIAGNDDILFTALSDQPTAPDAIFSAQRQGFGDYRHLILVKVPDLSQRLRQIQGDGLTLEHIHDY